MLHKEGRKWLTYFFNADAVVKRHGHGASVRVQKHGKAGGVVRMCWQVVQAVSEVLFAS